VYVYVCVCILVNVCACASCSYVKSHIHHGPGAQVTNDTDGMNDVRTADLVTSYGAAAPAANSSLAAAVMSSPGAETASATATILAGPNEETCDMTLDDQEQVCWFSLMAASPPTLPHLHLLWRLLAAALACWLLSLLVGYQWLPCCLIHRVIYHTYTMQRSLHLSLFHQVMLKLASPHVHLT